VETTGRIIEPGADCGTRSVKEDPAMYRLALLLGVALSSIATPAAAQSCDGFTDVLASSQFCPDVTWIAQYGVTKGCAPSQFCPNENVTRLQMAAFMHRLGENPAFVNGGNAFGKAAVLGTTDNQPLLLVVDGIQAVLVQPAVDPFFGFNPNVTNGSVVNLVALGVAGGTIAGGGGCNLGTGGACTVVSANEVIGNFGTVSGGVGNIAGGDPVSGGPYATVAGGLRNTASGQGSTVIGGTQNSATGDRSVVAGGFSNTASGNISFAAGNSAQATHDHSFVWSGWSSIIGAPSFFPNRFHIGADNGLSVDSCDQNAFGGGSCWVVIGGANAEHPGQAISTSTGAYLSSGGVWTDSSDRSLKADFTAVDAQAVLAKVAQLPIDEWSYKAESGQRHLGPVAQDFYAAFGLGADDKHISTVDEGGVALAAIKGLNAKVEKALDEKSRQLEEQAATIREQQREIAELSERVQKADTLAADVVALKAALAELQRKREIVAVK
jgi:hypothetical protein